MPEKKDLTECVEELAQLCKGTYLDEEAKRVLDAISMGFVLYHPYSEEP